MKKRILSFALVLCLIIPCMFIFSACNNVTYIEVSTFAELKQALTNEIENDVIVLKSNLDLKDVNDNQALKIESGKHVLDLNGYVLKGVDNGANSWHAIDVRGDSTELTIKDSSAEKTGTIIGRCYGIQVSRGAKLTIDGGNIVCTTNGTFNQNVVVYGGTLVINDGTFTSKVGETIFGSSYKWGDVEYHNSITINGGTFNNTATSYNEDTDTLMMFTKVSTITQPQVVVINGGTFNNGELPYVVEYDEYVDFTNNAQIPASKINA